MFTRVHETRNYEPNAKHFCKEKPKMHTICRLDSIGIMNGWYFVDESVEVKDGAFYGTAIKYCPYCGEKL